MRNRVLSLAAAAALVVSASAIAQPHIRVPQASPRAVVEETFGITDVKVSYHRPSVNGRKIFGGLVPYDVIWRAGANENTTVLFSTPVSIEGQPLAAGEYSLFMIPGQAQWTVVFNRFTGGWGTYSYDASEDVLQVKVTPEQAPMQERLSFAFDDGKQDSVVLSLRWDKLRVPVRISADTTKLTRASIRNELRSSLHWVPQAWAEAANFEFRSGNLETALEYANAALRYGDDAFGLRTKARIVEKMGDAKQAAALRERATALSPQQSALTQAYIAIGAKKYDEAIAMLEKQAAADPASFRPWNALGLAWAEKGDAAKSKAAFDKAMKLAKDQSERVEVQDTLNDLGSKP